MTFVSNQFISVFIRNLSLVVVVSSPWIWLYFKTAINCIRFKSDNEVLMVIVNRAHLIHTVFPIFRPLVVTNGATNSCWLDNIYCFGRLNSNTVRNRWYLNDLIKPNYKRCLYAEAGVWRTCSSWVSAVLLGPTVNCISECSVFTEEYKTLRMLMWCHH